MTAGLNLAGLPIEEFVFYDASRFVAPGNGTMPGTSLCGLAFDADAEEEAAPFMRVPASWPSVNVAMIGLPLATGTSKWRFTATPNASVLFDIVSAQVFVQEVTTIAQGLTFTAISAINSQTSTGHIARIGDDVGDTNTGDYIVFGLKFTPGA